MEMPRKRILLTFGTRPEAIKMAPVARTLRAMPEAFEVLCCVTAQHRELLDQALATFGIVPDFDLDLMRAGQDLTDIQAGVLRAMRPVLAQARPDLVLVHGDTTTALAAALAGFYAGVAVGHVEAGLRSGSLAAPFPEELNRRIIDMVARYHFAPTEQNRANLLREGADPTCVIVTGNTVVDALRLVLAGIDGDQAIRDAIEARLDRVLPFAWRAGRYVIVTRHRRESAAHGARAVDTALARLAERHPDVDFVHLVHPNSMPRRPLERPPAGGKTIHPVAPLPYDEFLIALRHCHCVLTDSGGLQEEAPALGKPVLVMRDVTERPEATQCGSVRLIGTDPGAIVAAVSELFTQEAVHARMAQAPYPFGDGAAAERIAAFLRRV